MAATFAQIQVVLGRRLGPCAALADLHEAVAYALAGLGTPPADMLAIADADLAGVTGARAPQLLDVAEWRGLEAIVANLCDSELKKIGLCGPADAFRAYYEARVARLALYVKNTYGVGAAELQVGTVKHDFQQQDDATSLNF